MNAKKRIKLLLLLALHCHTTESVVTYMYIYQDLPDF